MKLDNRRNTYQIWFRKLLATIILVILAVTIGYTDFFKTPVLGVDKTWYLVALAVGSIGISAYNLLLKPSYIAYSDNGDKIVLRYYPTRIFNSKKNSIEISKSNFVSWEIKKFFFGTCEMLYLTGKYKSGVARYPGVSLSAVNRKDREKIKTALNIYAKKNLN
jgi:hypothetical protein